MFSKNAHVLFEMIDYKYVVQRHQYVIEVTLKYELYGEHVQSMWKQIITHLYLSSMWDLSNPSSLHSQLLDFDSSEQWYRDTMALFRPLEGNVRTGLNTATLSTRRTL